MFLFYNTPSQCPSLLCVSLPSSPSLHTHWKSSNSNPTSLTLSTSLFLSLSLCLPLSFTLPLYSCSFASCCTFFHSLGLWLSSTHYSLSCCVRVLVCACDMGNVTIWRGYRHWKTDHSCTELILITQTHTHTHIAHTQTNTLTVFPPAVCLWQITAPISVPLDPYPLSQVP